MTVSWQCSSASWAIPAPIVPVPTTPTTAGATSVTSDGLELLERLAARGAVVDRTAAGGAEGVVENGSARAAVRTRHRRLDRQEDRATCLGASGGRGEARNPQLLAARLGDAVGRP